VQRKSVAREPVPRPKGRDGALLSRGRTPLCLTGYVFCSKTTVRIFHKTRRIVLNKEKIINFIAEEVRAKLEGEGSGHDWWHIVRVWNLAKEIAIKENAAIFVVELAALLHDIADWKFNAGDESAGARVARQILGRYPISETDINHICDIIATSSFKGAGVEEKMKTIEGMIVQDADRLDAIGAIGVARVFTYGGHKGRIIYDPKQQPVIHGTKEAYMKNESPSINHFFEKLLLLKDRMNTDTAKKLADGRHLFMEEFLDRFFKEWDGII
jgi:uncharacterized protein